MTTQRISRGFAVIGIVLALAVGVWPAAAQYCGAPQSVTLIAGQTITVGTVTVANDSVNLYVTYNTGTSGWLLTATHLAIATSVAEIPQNKGGNPQPGQFAYKRQYSPARATDTYQIPLNGWPPSTTLYIAAQADVVGTGGSEGAWAEGTAFPGGNWAMYFTYVVQSCGTNNPTILWRTQTQGGWGTVAKGNNPGSYRDEHFEGSFPSGLLIGTTAGHWAFFTSSAAVQCFLPQGGTPGTLQQNYTDPLGPPCDERSPGAASDPSSTDAGVLAGQVVALTLNVVFNLPGKDGSSPTPLGSLVVKEGACSGMTVQAVLNAANAVLAGDTSQFQPAAINDCAAKINENYVDGTTDKGYLTTP